MVTLPPYATDADLLAVVRGWVELLVAGEYAQAQALLDRSEWGRDWPPERVAEVIAAYDPPPQPRAKGAVRVTPVRHGAGGRFPAAARGLALRGQ